MPISRDDVAYVARLARLKLSGEEMKRFTSQLAEIVRYVEKLNALDTKGIEPTAHVLPLKNVARPDAICTSLPTDAALRSAPRKDDTFFKVPRVIE